MRRSRRIDRAASWPWDLGTWTGRPWHELDLESWRADPSYNAHGGESLIALLARVRALLDEWHTRPGRVAAVTHAAVIKAAVVHALRAPIEAMWQLTWAPSALTGQVAVVCRRSGSGRQVAATSWGVR